MDEPREFVHLTALYNELSERAEKGTYVGSMKTVLDPLNVSHVYYTRLPMLLEKLGCIDWVQKGVGRKPGQVVLIREPSLDDYLVKAKDKRLTTNAAIDSIRASVTATNRRLGNIDLPRWIASVEEQLVSMRQRLDALEAQQTEGGNDLAS